MTEDFKSDIEYMRESVKGVLSLIKRYQLERGAVPALLIQHLKNSGDVDEINLTCVLFDSLLSEKFEDILPMLEEYDHGDGEPYGPCELGREEAGKPRSLAEKMSMGTHLRAYQ